MSLLYYLCPWTTNYTISVESEDGSISKPERVCLKCGMTFQVIATLVDEVGEEKALSILERLFKDENTH